MEEAPGGAKGIVVRTMRTGWVDTDGAVVRRILVAASDPRGGEGGKPVKECGEGNAAAGGEEGTPPEVKASAE